MAESLYTHFKTGFLGDRAGVVCYLAKPRQTMSSRPHSSNKYVRVDFGVITPSDTFNLASIGQRIDEAGNLGLTGETVAVLKEARESLQEFIKENGSTNPAEEADWETSCEPVSALG